PAVTHHDACRLKRIEDGNAGRDLLEEQKQLKRHITRLEESVDLLLPYARVPKGCNRPADLIQRTIERLKELEAVAEAAGLVWDDEIDGHEKLGKALVALNARAEGGDNAPDMA
ncbi:unnamed protein product, partial [marine sediment metagenome]